MKLEGIIFDMDGTLIDSREIVLGAFKHVLEEAGENFDEAVVNTHVGRLLEDTYRQLLPAQDATQLADLHRSWQADHRELLKGFSGLGQFLADLKKQGLKLGIYTSATRPRTDLALDGLAIRNYFDAIVCGNEVTKPKPDKEGVVTVAEAMDVPLANVVMVGDAEHDIKSGKHAGVVTIGITHGFGSRESLEAAGADYIVNNLAELSDKLDVLRSHGS